MTSLPENGDRCLLDGKPRLVFRVAFAGNARFPDQVQPSAQQGRIHEVLEKIALCLDEIAPGTSTQADESVPEIARFYSPEKPLLRVVTGLCEGADELAFEAAAAVAREGVEVRHAGVLSFRVEDYWQSRTNYDPSDFRRRISACEYVVSADGLYDPRRTKTHPAESPEAIKLAERRRSRGYRCQSELLLRQCDMLVVLADLSKEGKAGGTLETIRKALAFQLPVLVLDLQGKADRIVTVEPGEVVDLELEGDHDPNWSAALRSWVKDTVANPKLSSDTHGAEGAEHGRLLLDEYFRGLCCDGDLLSCADSKAPPKRWWTGWTWWGRFESSFQVKGYGGLPKPCDTPGQAEVMKYRDVARGLGAHYAGLYRKLFFRNAIYALTAVFLATVSLLIIGKGPDLADQVFSLKDNGPGLKGKLPVWMILLLVILALGKLTLVWKIFTGTEKGNKTHWNDRGVDYRYLAERLRALQWLPAAGIFQPPAAAPPQYASRVVRQSAADWLFDALTRSISPAGWATPTQVGIDGQEIEISLMALDPQQALAAVKDGWLEEQWLYHRRNALKMRGMSTFLESLGGVLNVLVMLFVVFDLFLLGLKLAGAKEGCLGALVGVAPFIVLATAIFPAAVAAVNVIRFQSECEHLAERSLVLARLLGGFPDRAPVHPHGDEHGKLPAWLESVREFFLHFGEKVVNLTLPFQKKDPLIKEEPSPGSRLAQAEGLAKNIADKLCHPATDPGAHCLPVLIMTEAVAEMFVQEVAEWSVLYAQEIIEP